MRSDLAIGFGMGLYMYNRVDFLVQLTTCIL